MSGNFHLFQSLPRELQIMVFEEFVMASLNPRIALLDTQEQALFVWDNHLLGWQWSIGNREQLEQGSLATVAATLLQVNTTARYVANQFLDRLGQPINPPRTSEAMMGLGLSLSNDIFWLPDDLPHFLITTMGAPVVLGPTDDESISNIMISLRAFEVTLRWAMKRGEQYEEDDEFEQFLAVVLINVVDSFPAAWDLTIMVDVPRGNNVSWDQVQIVAGNDPALSKLGGDLPRRCQRAYDRYEWLNQNLVEDDPNRAWPGRPLPRLSFAFLKPVRDPTSPATM
jgi:hypothetical protein